MIDLSAVSLLHPLALHRNPLAIVIMVPGGSPQLAWLCCVSRHRAFAQPLTTIAGESGFGEHNLTVQCRTFFTAAHCQRRLGSSNGKKKLSLILYINYCLSLHPKSTLCRNKFISLMMLLQRGIFPQKVNINMFLNWHKCKFVHKNTNHIQNSNTMSNFH